MGDMAALRVAGRRRVAALAGSGVIGSELVAGASV